MAMNSTPSSGSTAPAAPSGASPGPASRSAPGRAGARRARFLVQVSLLLAAVTAACVFAGIAASRRHVRWDVTATREHRLSPRTLKVLEGVRRPTTILVAGDFSSIDPTARTRTADVLQRFVDECPNLRVRTVDTTSAAGAEEFGAFFGGLRESAAPALLRCASAVQAARQAAGTLRPGLSSLAAELSSLRDALPEDEFARGPREYLSDRVARCAAGADQLAESVRELDELMGASSAGVAAAAGVPAYDSAAAAVRPVLTSVDGLLADLARTVNGLLEDRTLSEVARERAAAVSGAIGPLGDDCRAALAELEAMPRVALLAAARLAERASVVLVVGESESPDASAQITALEFAALFPPAAGGGGADALPLVDQRAKAEELLSSAIWALSDRTAPIVVFVHAAPVRLAPDYSLFSAAVQRLTLRRMDVLEWPVALEDQPPKELARLMGTSGEGGAGSGSGESGAPGSARPVVYIMLPTAASTPEAAIRMGTLANRLEELTRSGASMLVSVTPSGLAAIGQPDPLVSFLAPLGLRVDSSRVVLEREAGATAGAPGVTLSEQWFTPVFPLSHPVAQALAGLAVRLPWPVAIHTDAVPGFAAVAVLTLPPAAERWAEPDWTGLRELRARDSGAEPASPPTADSARDISGVAFTLVAACVAGEGGQRVMVVGSNGWFFDQITRAGRVVDNRTVYDAPANLELLEAAVYFLAGQDERIAQSASGRTMPTIRPMTGSEIGMMRWLLAAGLPGVILLVGVLHRILRG